MIYVRAACVDYGYYRTSGAELGTRVVSLNLVEMCQKMWKRHFGPHLFEAETISETLLYNLQISLEVSDQEKSPVSLHFAQQLRGGLRRSRSSRIVCLNGSVENFCGKN
jgi:hypothetical protein